MDSRSNLRIQVTESNTLHIPAQESIVQSSFLEARENNGKHKRCKFWFDEETYLSTWATAKLRYHGCRRNAGLTKTRSPGFVRSTKRKQTNLSSVFLPSRKSSEAQTLSSPQSSTVCTTHVPKLFNASRLLQPVAQASSLSLLHPQVNVD